MSGKVALWQEYSLPNCLLSLHKFLFMRNSDIQTGLSYQVVVVVLPTFKKWCSGEGGFMISFITSFGPIFTLSYTLKFLDFHFAVCQFHCFSTFPSF